MFYEFDQNNSGGGFVVNNELCHRLIIEADSHSEAVSKAEDLGCYWNGVEDGMDCPCCGDRWSCYWEHAVDIEKYNTVGYKVCVFDRIYHNTEKKWYEKYGKYEIIEKPKFVKTYSTRRYEGTIRFKNIEEYAQFMADEYGWTTPDTRIFYKDGTVKEIFTERKEH